MKHLFRRAAALALLVTSLGCTASRFVEFDGPTVLTRFEVHDASNRLLWRLDGDGSVGVVAFDFGVVPPGYSQVFPSSAAPRDLVDGEPLLLVYVWLHRGAPWWNRHWGSASGAHGFDGGVWRGGPLEGTPLETVFEPGEHPIVAPPDSHPR